MKAEYVAASTAAQEDIWLTQFLRDLEVVTHASNLVTLHCDSMVAIGYMKNAKYHAKTKHIDIKFNFISNRSQEVT